MNFRQYIVKDSFGKTGFSLFWQYSKPVITVIIIQMIKKYSAYYETSVNC